MTGEHVRDGDGDSSTRPTGDPVEGGPALWTDGSGGEPVPSADRSGDTRQTNTTGARDTASAGASTADRIGTVTGETSLGDAAKAELGSGMSVERPPLETVPGERKRSRRARGMELVAAGLIAIGIVTGTAEAFLMTVPLVLGILYHRATGLGEIDLEASRDFSKVSVVPGETVTVTVTVTNAGEASVSDLRIRDDVPDRLSVVEGTPMASFSLEPGAAATLSYEVTARRGTHEFREVEVICRNASGSERERRILSAPRTLVAESSLGGMPLDARASQYTGRLETTFRGSGVEFHSTREYHTSDSPRDIDWRTFAKTREFTTIEYKDTRAASIHLVVDSREAAQQHTGANAVTSRELCLYAAEQVAEFLIDDRHEVGLSSIGTGSGTYLPAKNPKQYRRIRREFGLDAEDGSDVSRVVEATRADEFVTKTASHTQFVCFTGLYDDGFDAFLDRLAKHGRPVLVVSPRHELVSTPGSQLTTLQRRIRIESLRRDGVRVLDWDTDEPLRLAIQRRVGGLWE